jgi:hypothetical protein
LSNAARKYKKRCYAIIKVLNCIYLSICSRPSFLEAPFDLFYTAI